MKSTILFSLLFLSFCIYSQSSSITFKDDKGVWVTTDRAFVDLQKLPKKLKFKESSAKPTKESIKYLNANISNWNDYINKNENLNSISIDFGSENLDTRRANFLMNYFLANGVDPKKISTIGHGESSPTLDKNYSLNILYDFSVPESELNIRNIEGLESYGNRVDLPSPEEEKIKRISFLIKNKDNILQQCSSTLNKPISPNKFSGITLYGYSKLDGSVDLGFFQKIFNASAKIDKYKSKYLNGFYEDEYCKCKINNKDYNVKVAWFFGVVNDMEIENKGGKLKISGIDFVSAAVTMNRASVKSSIYALGLYNMNSEPPYDITSFDVKEYSKFNSYVNSFLDLRKKISSNETTFDPELILLEWYELTK